LGAQIVQGIDERLGWTPADLIVAGNDRVAVDEGGDGS
jgi:hypothetical protein